MPKTTAFGEQITADHTFARSERDKSLGEEEVMLAVRDIHTQWIEAYPMTSKSNEDAVKAFKGFIGLGPGGKHFYSDEPPELKRRLSWGGFTPDRSLAGRKPTALLSDSLGSSWPGPGRCCSMQA